MSQAASNFHITHFRNRAFAWIMLTIFCFSFLPSASLAQQPTATIRTLSGNVQVSGQSAIVGTVLQARDTIQTQTRASAVLAFSDGSELHLAENTQVTIADLAQTATGARISSIKLLAGKLRALLSPGHQQEGSSFTVETPNALIGVKFSEPDIEVSYNPESIETVGIAHTVEMMAKNLLTDEEVLVPVGSSVIIVGTTMKIIAGMLAISGTAKTVTTGTEATTTGASSTGVPGMGTGTKVAIGVGATAAVVGGGVALATTLQEEANDDNISFTGTFARESFPGGSLYEVYTLVQNGLSVTGNLSVTDQWEGCGVNHLDLSITGTVNEGRFSFYLPFGRSCASCDRWDIDSHCIQTEPGDCTGVLFDDGRTFVVDGSGMIGSSGPYIRQ